MQICPLTLSELVIDNDCLSLIQESEICAIQNYGLFFQFCLTKLKL